jgi:PII-like signaling protein
MPGSSEVARLAVQLPGAALWHHRPVYAEIVHRARRQGLAGVSVFQGVEGFGADRRIHHEHALRVTFRGPVEVIVVEDEQRLRDFLLTIADLLEHTSATAVLNQVTVHRPGATGGAGV